ncbi:MAG: BBE domain-containing protein [Solirubrobacteraceae bacterium]
MTHGHTDQRRPAAVNSARELIAKYGNGQAYRNSSDLDLSSPRTAYHGANLRRLESIKAQVDPNDRFRLTQGIRS